MTVSWLDMPNYDLPNAAPEPLRRVQLLVNSIDREHGREWLPDWLAERGLPASEFERAKTLREALRKLLYVNNVGGSAPEALAVLNDAARDVSISVRDDKVVLDGADPISEVVAISLMAMIDGSWLRLKVCRKCEWSFYDTSKNRAGSWCSMQLCGNRLKTRAYRARRRAA